MHDIDARAASSEWAIPPLALMEAAGAAFAQAIIQALHAQSAKNKRVAIACGRGSNGGDGFVAARHLAERGAHVTVFLAGSPDKLKGDAAVYFACAAPVVRVAALPDADCPDPASPFLFERFDLWGDALLGTGAKGVPTGAIAFLIQHINAVAQNDGVPVVSADIPSGLDADTGTAADETLVVRATHTVTFALPKPGLLMFPGATFAGQISLANIGLPRALLCDNPDLTMELTTHEFVQAMLPPRRESRDSNKGAYGTVLVIAGSAGMAGAACLSALSALRGGAGLVMLAVPESLLDTAAALAPEAVLHGLPETPERTHGGEGALEAALELAEKADAVAIGPGMGGSGNPEVVSFVQNLIQQLGKPLVIDADGLNALAQNPDGSQKRSGPPPVLTPHPGEMGRLMEMKASEVQAERLKVVRHCAEKYHAVALLKGTRTLIADAGGAGKIAFNRKGSVALATAGTGDILTGVIAAMLAQSDPQMSPYDAARTGAYLHALAGEQAARTLGRAGVIASDVMRCLPEARERLYGEETLDEL